MKFLIELFIAIMLLVFVAPKVEVKVKQECSSPTFKSEVKTRMVNLEKKIPKGAELPKAEQ